MTFVYPEFLWALCFLTVPVIIHLFNFRKYKTVEFSDIRFLKEVKEESRKKSNIKHLLILLCRLLALTALVFAFAQPYAKGDNDNLKEGSTAVSIYVDNSFSMDSEGNDGRYLDMARQMAVEIAEKYGAATQFQLLTNKMSGSEQRLMNKENFLTQLDALTISSESRTFPDLFKRQAEILTNAEASNKIAYAISDFQSSMLTENIPSDSIAQFNAILLKSNNRSNAFIDSVWFETPVRKLNGIETLRVRIGNESDSLINVKLTRDIDGQSSTLRVPVQARSKVIADLKFSNKKVGPIQAKLHLSLNAQMRFDDTLYFTYNVLKEINVLEISNSDKNTFFNIYGNDELFNYTKTTPGAIDLSTIPAQNLIVLNGLNNISTGLAGQLGQFIKNGGSVGIFPGTRIDANSYARFLTDINANAYNGVLNKVNASLELKTYNKDHIFFKQVFEKENPNMNLPKVSSYYSISGTYNSQEEVLFSLHSGKPFLAQYPVGSGKIYLCASPLDESFSNFIKHGLFVTSALRMAELSHATKALYYDIGGDQYPWISDLGYNPEINFMLSRKGINIIPIADRSKDGIISLISTYGKDQNAMITKAGVYDLRYDTKTLEKIGFNYPRYESVLEFAHDKEALDTYLASYHIGLLSTQNAQDINDVVQSIQEDGPKKYWKLCLIFALSFIALEILLIKLWKS